MSRSNLTLERRSSPSAKGGDARLDSLLVARGLAESREKAQALIMAGSVKVDGQVARKAGARVAETSRLEVNRGQEYVSRGGHKLAHALDCFGLSVAGVVALDVGASTGGFTDCLLQRGAARVYAVDVGYGQLAWKLRQDPRVVVMERVNARYLPDLPEKVDLATIDVSFISLLLVLGPVLRQLEPAGYVIALIKPQFEAGPSQVPRGGVVRDPEVHAGALERVLLGAANLGLFCHGLTASPLKGDAGNTEFLAYLAPWEAPSHPTELIQDYLASLRVASKASRLTCRP